MKYAFFITFLLDTITFAQEDVKIEIAKIARMENSIERLSAFDALAVKLKLSPGSQRSETSSGKWRIGTETSAIDDSKVITAILDANDLVGKGIHQSYPVLVVRLKGGLITVHVKFHMFLGIDKIDTTIMFGKEDAIGQSWDVSTDNMSVFSPDSSLKFMDHLKSVDSFLIRVTPYNKYPVTASFMISRFDKVNDAIIKGARDYAVMKVKQYEINKSK